MSTGSEDVDARIAALDDWRGETLTRVRTLIKEADPDVTETVKWRKAASPLGVPVWEHDGILTTGEVYKDKIKLTFAHGASLPDPQSVFNGRDNGATRRSIDIAKGTALDEAAFKALVREAVKRNSASRA